MYNVYNWDYDLVKVVSTLEEAKKLVEHAMPGETWGDDPLYFKKRDERLRHPIDIIVECNPDLLKDHPGLANVVNWLDKELILGDTDVLDVTYDDHRIICVKHEYADGCQQGRDFYNFERGELV